LSHAVPSTATVHCYCHFVCLSRDLGCLDHFPCLLIMGATCCCLQVLLTSLSSSSQAAAQGTVRQAGTGSSSSARHLSYVGGINVLGHVLTAAWICIRGMCCHPVAAWTQYMEWYLVLWYCGAAQDVCIRAVPHPLALGLGSAVSGLGCVLFRGWPN
jgi:hypothetical protein